jgi:hypothetical protein
VLSAERRTVLQQDKLLRELDVLPPTQIALQINDTGFTDWLSTSTATSIATAMATYCIQTGQAAAGA